MVYFDHHVHVLKKDDSCHAEKRHSFPMHQNRLQLRLHESKIQLECLHCSQRHPNLMARIEIWSEPVFGKLHYYITSFQTPVTPTVTNGASTKSFKFSECELKKVSFQKFFESISICEFLGDWTEGNSTPSVRRTRHSARRTLVSTLEVHIGSCWRTSVSHDQAGQLRMSSCPTGTQDCDQLAPGA